MARFDIVIPHYGSGHLTELCVRCLQTIRAYSEDYRVILVDNASPEPGPVLEELDRHPSLYVHNSENLGFIRATNQGIRLATAPYIVLLNNDTEVAAEWLLKLHAAFAGSYPIGITGPLSTADGSWQGRWKSTGAKVHLLAPGRMLAFFCAMVDRQVFETIGLLDETYGVGFGDDDEFCRRAERGGFRLALAQDLRIHHHHRSTFKAIYGEEEIKRMQDRALAKFHASR